jgi:diguanylate cyclase (GGDEF)-like protein
MTLGFANGSGFRRLPTDPPGSTRRDPSQLQFLDARADLRLSYKAKRPWRAPAETGGYSHIYPVSDGRDVLCLVEIRCLAKVEDVQERMIASLIRIYCNHANILDYSGHDELTGLLNRRTFNETVKQIAWPDVTPSTYPALQHADAREVRAYLAVADIDFFKRINDQFGHPYGDEVLVLLARLMGRCFRDTDYLFRFGGEEFVIILRGTGPLDAEIAFERFRAAVEEFAFPQVGRVTVSVGMTAILHGDGGSSAFGRADEALYFAKQGGRNKVCCYEMLVGAGVLTERASQEDNVELF